ncbi:MAG: periplasmic heavy metal sensor [Bacillota bacterium]
MKRKAAIFIVVALLLVGLTQVGFAATGDESPGGRFKEACQDLWANLSPEQQEQAEAAHEEYREQVNALREEFQTKHAALRDDFLNKLPAEVREQMEEMMAARGERRGGKMHSRGPGFGCQFETETEE